MKTSSFFSFLGSALLVSLSVVRVSAQDNTTSDVADTIISNAASDSIDLTVLGDILPDALAEVVEVLETSSGEGESPTKKRSISRLLPRQAPSPNNIVDVHTHAVPSWYKVLVPVTGQNPTPDWTLQGHIDFMNTQGIERSVIAISAPGANVFPGDKAKTLALARLLNEQVAAYCRAQPNRLDFYAIVPLPYTAEAITEARYAINTLGAVGIMMFSNFEGRYLGNAELRPFFTAVNNFGGRQILYIHPATPYVTGNNGQRIEANPTPYPTGNIEFYFETARTIMDLTLTQTIHTFTNIHYVIPHVGGAFPATVDRILKSVPAIYDSSFAIYKTRFWWDSAGPTYFHQVAGLLGIEIPKSQLLYGTDLPYAPSFTQAGSLAAVKASTLFTAQEKTAIFRTNAQTLFGNKIQW
ncbi:hypothetical protein BKA70DRAFT_1229091 [Coprinopsis sp. MPI-PUGE-AT-0042]|nr:hypothetical protein BKA70DRAFT_1229091 [Coprinopsis sp. MPI-PUGE-AT-0042]